MKSTSNVVFQASQDTIQTDSIVAWLLTLEVIIRRRLVLFVLIAVFLVIPLTDVTNFMAILLVIRFRAQIIGIRSHNTIRVSRRRLNQSLCNLGHQRETMWLISFHRILDISMHDHNGVHLGSVTTDQIQKLLSVLNNQPVSEQISQVSGSTLKLSDGSVSVIKPQPHLIPHTSNPFETGTLSTSNHFVSSAGIDHSLPLNAPAWVIDTGASCHVCFDLTKFTDTI